MTLVYCGVDGEPRRSRSETTVAVQARFLPLSDVAEILNISISQARALVRSGELPAIRVGGRGQWRVENTELENYIQRMYREVRDEVSQRD
nr:helix-turn-helix domain-containing protein [Sediminivirga luteola]